MRSYLLTTPTYFTATRTSGKLPRKGVIPSTRALTYRMAGTWIGFVSGLETRMRLKLKMLQSRLPSATGFYIPLDFELLETHVPFYQSALGDRLDYELTFNDYSRVVVSTGDAAASYTVENIALEFDKVTQPDLARQIRNQYGGRLAILYDRVLRHQKITANKSDTLSERPRTVNEGHPASLRGSCGSPPARHRGLL